MIEPIEAEVARPPIFTAQQEATLRDEEVERDGAITGSNHSDSQTLHDHAVEAEKAKGRIIVDFEPGSREDPRNWSNGRKWYCTLSCALLCLTVALGSAMPTGDLKSQAHTLHVSMEAIFLSITLFVLGFGVGPLIFAPRESPQYPRSWYLANVPQCLSSLAASPFTASRSSSTSSSPSPRALPRTLRPCWLVV